MYLVIRFKTCFGLYKRMYVNLTKEFVELGVIALFNVLKKDNLAEFDSCWFQKEND